MVERRQEARKEKEILTLEIIQNNKKNSTLVVPVSCISEKGLSFYVPADNFHLREGEILYNIRLFNNETDKFIEKSRVVYCIKVDMEESESFYKIGITFLVNSKKFNIRNKRFHLINHKHNLKFKINNEHFTGLLNDISKYGISIMIKNVNKYKNLFITKGSVIKNIFLEFEEVFFDIGEATIVHVEFLSKNLIIRASLSNKFIPIDNLLELKNQKQVDSMLNNLQENLTIKNLVDTHFKNKVLEFRYILDNIKKSFDIFENEVKYYEPKIKNIYTVAILHETNHLITESLNKTINDISNITKDLTTEQYEIYSKYYKQNLQLLIQSAPINEILITKPFGYIGDIDFEDYILKNDYAGLTLYDKFLHKYTIETPILASYAKIIDNNLKNIKRIINEKLKNQNIIKIGTICSGNTTEISDLIKNFEPIDNCEIEIIFTNEHNLNQCKKIIEKLKNKYKKYSNIKFELKSICSIVNNNTALFADKKDLIFLSNIFEFMPDIYASKLIFNIYSSLNQSAIFLFNHLNNDFEFKSYFEMGFDWFVNYREKPEIMELLQNVLNNPEPKIKNNKTFLSIELEKI